MKYQWTRFVSESSGDFFFKQQLFYSFPRASFCTKLVFIALRHREIYFLSPSMAGGE